MCETPCIDITLPYKTAVNMEKKFQTKCNEN